jgi:hypothetical protein
VVWAYHCKSKERTNDGQEIKDAGGPRDTSSSV